MCAREIYRYFKDECFCDDRPKSLRREPETQFFIYNNKKIINLNSLSSKVHLFYPQLRTVFTYVDHLHIGVKNCI